MNAIIDLMSDEAVYQVAQTIAPHIKTLIPIMTDEELAAVKTACTRSDFDADEMRAFLKKLYVFAVKHTSSYKI